MDGNSRFDADLNARFILRRSEPHALRWIEERLEKTTQVRKVPLDIGRFTSGLPPARVPLALQLSDAQRIDWALKHRYAALPGRLLWVRGG